MHVDLALTYRSEAAELLSDLETSLLELETAPDNSDLIARTFRALHTLKGSGGVAGFKEIVRFAHEVESVFDRVRNGKLAIDKELLTLSLRAKDHLATLLATGPEAESALVEESDRLCQAFRPYMGAAATDGGSAKPTKANSAPGNTTTASYWIRFQPPEDAIASGMNPLGLLDELAEMGEIRVAYQVDAIPPLEQLVADQTYGWWDMVLQTSQTEDAIRDTFMFVDEGCVQIQPIGLVGKVRVSDQERLLGVARGVMDRDRACSSLQECVEHIRREITKRKPSSTPQVDTSMKVDTAKLDKLIDMVGELVIIQSRLSMAVRQFKDAGLTQIAEELERLSDGMRGNALGLRMLPIGTVFNGFRRMIRDVTEQLGKDVEFVTAGEDTEVDKTMIDRLKDPLMHILRNAIDHGLEPPEERQLSGKPARGTVRLSADNTSGDVRITIQDDGRGIDLNKVRAKAIAKGLITLEASLSRKELFSLLFEPGFSTADKVSDISGRGVGMDVVKKGIDAMRGSIDIDSTLQHGSTFAIRLPLTLAIIDGLAVRIGSESFILPLATVEACQERSIHSGTQRLVDNITRNAQLIPCVSLRQLLNVPGDLPGYERVIIAKVESLEIGLAVDRVIGRQQAVVKSLSGMFQALEWISGTTINGDGGISLILDVPQLIKFAYTRSQGGMRAHA